MHAIESHQVEKVTNPVFDVETHTSNINAYYDSPAIILFEQMAKQQIHLGYWDERYPNVTMAEAAQRLTQVVIDQLEIPCDGYLLDIGCGCGQPAMEIVAQKKCYVEGITINPQQKKKAEAYALEKGLANQTNFRVGDAAVMPYPDEQFHSALLFESIHHIGHEDALREAWRILKPGSTVLVADGVVLKDAVPSEARKQLFDTFVSKSLVTREQLAAELYAAGFEEVEIMDLSRAIQPTWDKLMESTVEQRDEIVAQNGIEFFTSLVEFWRQMNVVWTNNARYLVAKACKPAS